VFDARRAPLVVGRGGLLGTRAALRGRRVPRPHARPRPAPRTWRRALLGRGSVEAAGGDAGRSDSFPCETGALARVGLGDGRLVSRALGRHQQVIGDGLVGGRRGWGCSVEPQTGHGSPGTSAAASSRRDAGDTSTQQRTERSRGGLGVRQRRRVRSLGRGERGEVVGTMGRSDDLAQTQVLGTQIVETRRGADTAAISASIWARSAGRAARRSSMSARSCSRATIAAIAASCSTRRATRSRS
jgi:hypothetical protein